MLAPRAMRKTGVPAKFILWGDSTEGLSHGRSGGKDRLFHESSIALTIRVSSVTLASCAYYFTKLIWSVPLLTREGILLCS